MLQISDTELEVLRALFARLAIPGSTVASAACGETFEEVGRRWYEHTRKSRWTDRHAKEVIDTLERDVFPEIGASPIAGISPPEALAALRKIEKRGSVETAHRVRQRMSAIFRFAIAEGIASSDPAGLVGKAMTPAEPQQHHPALLDLESAQELLAAMNLVAAGVSCKLASRFLALTATRAATVRLATWSEIEDLDGPNPLWRIPAKHMKMSAAKKRNAANCLVPEMTNGTGLTPE